MHAGRRTAVGLVALVLLGSAGLTGCDDTGASDARTPVAGRSPDRTDYLRDAALNRRAADAAGRLETALSDRPGFAYLRIVATGLELGRTAAGSALPARAATVNRGSGVPLSDRVVRFDQTQLRALVTRLGRDRARLGRHGIHLSAWGPDDRTDTVRVDLSTYSRSAADRLRARYGPMVSVEPRSVVPEAD